MNPGSSDRPVILYFGNDWFAENRTSSHHIARRLAQRGRVYYLGAPGLRAPQGSGRDLKRVVGKVWQFLRGVRPVEAGLDLKVGTLLQLPFHRFRLVYRFNEWFVKATLRWLMWREGVRRPILWLVAPHLPFLIDQLGERLSVFYCVDDYAAYPNVHAAAVRAMDEATARAADLVFVTSEPLLEIKRRLNPNSHLSPHGVDVELFGQAQSSPLSIPPDVTQFARPMIGYFGLIERWIDLDLIRYVAEQRPQWTFLLIGRVAVPQEEIPRLPNVLCIGPRPYAQLPSYGQLFDVAWIPSRQNAWSFHSNPLKLREYLAMGKPVVAVRTPATEQFADVIELAQSPEEFLARFDALLSHPSAPGEIRRRMQRVAGESWDARVDRIWEVVEQHLALAVGNCQQPAAALDGAKSTSIRRANLH